MSGLTGPFITEPRDTRAPETACEHVNNALQVIEFERVLPGPITEKRFYEVLRTLKSRLTRAQTELLKEIDSP